MSTEITTLTLEPDNPSNTELRDGDGKVLYAVQTVFSGSKTLTHVRDAEGSLLATLEWRDVLSDRVTIGSGKKMGLGEWLRKSVNPFSSTVTWKDETKRKYRWEGNGPGLQLELYADDASRSDPIAQFQRSRRAPDPNTPPTPARLLLAPRALEVRDSVVLSFLFLEKSRRATDNSTQHRADVLGTAQGA